MHDEIFQLSSPTSQTSSSREEIPSDAYREGKSPSHITHATGNVMCACTIICKDGFSELPMFLIHFCTVFFSIIRQTFKMTNLDIWHSKFFLIQFNRLSNGMHCWFCCFNFGIIPKTQWIFHKDFTFYSFIIIICHKNHGHKLVYSTTNQNIRYLHVSSLNINIQSELVKMINVWVFF